MATAKSEMINGVLWTAIGKYSGIVVNLVISMVLARLLCPQEFGLVAIATVLIQFLSIFCHMGIGPAIIQRKDLTQTDLNNIFTFTIFLGIFLSIIFFLASWPIAAFYDNIKLRTICQILSINVFFSAVNMVPNALMNKNKRFKENAIRTLLLHVISGTFAVVTAFYGAGCYALLVSPIITSIGIYFYNQHFYRVTISSKFSLAPIKSIFSYSIYQFLFEFFNYFSRNVDKLIIGRYISAEALGYYDKSYRLMQLPLQNLTSVINPVIQPIMSHLQDDMHEMADKYNKIIAFIGTISFPIAVILYFCASDIIVIMFGEQWLYAIPAFKILALSIPSQMILSSSGAIWQSCNATKYMFWTGMVNTVIVVTGFFVGSYFYGTIEAVAWGWTGAALITFTCTFFTMYKFVLRSSFMMMIKKLINPCGNAVILITMFILLEHVNIDLHNRFLHLSFSLLCSLLLSVLYLKVTGRVDVIKIIRSRKIGKLQ